MSQESEIAALETELAEATEEYNEAVARHDLAARIEAHRRLWRAADALRAARGLDEENDRELG